MLKPVLLFTCLLTASYCYCQDSLTTETLVIEGQDTFVKMPLMRARILFAKVADLSQGIRDRDTIIATKQSRIDNLKAKSEELKTALDFREQIITTQLGQIENLQQVNRNTKKIWLRRLLYGTSGGLIAGVITGILIIK